MERRSSVRARSNSLISGATTNGTTGNGNTGTRTRHKSGNASYADLITRAILSSEEKRLTLSEIYDWMVDNVPGLKDQRYLHSAKGWKNAVRHTLSINPRFRKVARLGRPGWWTVDAEYLQRSNIQAGLNPHASSTSLTTATFIWDAQSTAQRQQQQNGQEFRGRLSSAPALFLSPIFASATSTPGNVSFPSPTLVSSRPPSSMSILSASTPVSSPKSEMSPPLVTMPVDNNNTQTVQIWQEGGVGLLTVPRPLPMRVSNVHETATQTDENVINYGQQPDNNNAFRRFRDTTRMCDYFENVSPISSPLGLNLAPLDQSMTSSSDHHEQNPVLDRYRCSDAGVWASLAHLDNGQPILVLTNTTLDRSVIGNQSTSTNQSESKVKQCNCNTRKIVRNPWEELPEDLEGIDVDPLVGCDVAAVIRYEQDMGKVPKVEPQST